MTGAQDEARRALIQYLKTDRSFGLTWVPIPRAAGEPPPPPSRGEAEGKGPRKEPVPARGLRTQPAASAALQRVVSPEEQETRAAALRGLDEQNVQGCRKCGLAQTRTRTVFGQGNPSARVVFVGEAPGAEEDRQGLAFVGRAGQLLTRMVAAMGLTRDDVYICNIIKCRPPNNREPAPDEIAACSPYLMEQLSVLKPQVVVALGAPAARTLLQTHEPIGRLRGRFHDFYVSGSPLVGDPIPVMPTFHPAYLLRNPEEKRKAWEDLQKVMERLGLPLPTRP